jgi:hypothetical protein
VAQPAAAPTVTADGHPLATRAWVTSAGAVLLPLRDLTQALGAQVQWFPEERKVELRRGDRLIELWIMTPVAQVDHTPVQLTSPPLMREGTTYLPLRLLAEAFGWRVLWDAAQRAVKLATPTALPPPAAPPPAALSPAPTAP